MKPSTFKIHPWDSVFKNSESETIARNVMAILARTGDEWRVLTWKEYKKERLKDGHFKESEKGYFDKIAPYCLNAQTAALFSPSWAELAAAATPSPLPETETGVTAYIGEINKIEDAPNYYKYFFVTGVSNIEPGLKHKLRLAMEAVLKSELTPPTPGNERQGRPQIFTGGQMKWTSWGETITITNFEGDVLKINPSGNYDSGIPSSEDVQLAKEVVFTLNNAAMIWEEHEGMYRILKLMSDKIENGWEWKEQDFANWNNEAKAILNNINNQ